VSEGFFWDRVSWTICPGWLQTKSLLISASWVARIMGVSPTGHLAYSFLKISKIQINTYLCGNIKESFPFVAKFLYNRAFWRPCSCPAFWQAVFIITKYRHGWRMDSPFFSLIISFLFSKQLFR
jgi:hypothetical protein